MKHLDGGTLVTLRDREPVPTGAADHLAACGECAEAMREAENTAGVVAAALGSLEDTFDLERARAVVRARVAEASAAAAGSPALVPPARRGAQALARAAGLVLIAAAGASALPGSPVREWVADLVSGNQTPAAEPVPSTPPAGAEEAGIRVSVDPSATVRISGVMPGHAVEVTWVPGDQVAVFAPSGSRFGSDAEGVAAVVAGGPVRIELPTGVRPLTLDVGGRVWLRSLDRGVEFLVSPENPSATTLRFLVPEPER